MKLRHSLTCLLTVCAALGLSPRADACGASPSGLTESFPKDGEIYPVNAPLLFSGYDISLDGVTVTVDGQAATLKDTTTGPLATVANIAATIEPQPTPGQTVVISGNFCPNFGCMPTSIQFTAGAEDNDPPPVTEVSVFNIHDYPDYKSGGGDCTGSSDLAWYFLLETSAPAPGESPRIYTLERSPDPSFATSEAISIGFARTDSFEVTHRDFAANLGGKSAPEAFCFRVSTTDVVGNMAAVSQVACKPCLYRVETGPTPVFQPSQPAWSSADTYPGGTCDMGTGGGGGGAGGGGPFDDGNEGDDVFRCGCRAAGSADSAPGALAGLVLALGAALRTAPRRRRRRSVR